MHFRNAAIGRFDIYGLWRLIGAWIFWHGKRSEMNGLRTTNQFRLLERLPQAKGRIRRVPIGQMSRRLRLGVKRQMRLLSVLAIFIWSGFCFDLGHRFVGDIEIGRHVLHIVVIVECFDKFENFLAGLGIKVDGILWNTSYRF